MIAIFGNCRGIGQASTVRSFRELCNSHRPNVLFLFEVKLNYYDKLSHIVNSL